MNKNLWIIWWILLIFVLLNTVAFFVSSRTKTIEFTLDKNREFEIELFSFSSYNISMKILFSKTDDLDKTALGEWQTKNNRKKTGVLKFINPGEPVKLLLKDEQQEVIYEALPSNSYNTRAFVVYENDHQPNQFSWGACKDKGFKIKRGFNDFKITVLEVGKSLQGREVKLYINPPLGFKQTVNSPLYKFLWFFYLWPVYLFLLFVIYLVLMFKKRDQSKK